MRFFLVGFFAILLCIASAFAQLRLGMESSQFFNPESTSKAGPNFTPGPKSPFRGGGGVFLQGSAVFYEESDGSSTPLPLSDIDINYSNGRTSLIANGQQYFLNMHEGLACPLSRMVLRGGTLAYTIPPAQDNAVRQFLDENGLIAVFDDVTQEAVASEFAGTVFYKLVRGADFAAVNQISGDLEGRALSAINAAAGLRRFDEVRDIYPGSYVNSDAQVTYQVFLVGDESNKVEIGGVPFRYSWDYDLQKEYTPVLSGVTIWSMDGLSTSEQPSRLISRGVFEEFSQYDYILFYQVSGIFRTLAEANPERFQQYSSASCEQYVVSNFGYDVRSEDWDAGIAVPPVDGSYPISELGELTTQLEQDFNVLDSVLWVTFEVPSSQLVKIDVTTQGSGDPTIRLFNAAGLLLGFDDDGGQSLNSRLELELEPGRYYLAINEFNGATMEGNVVVQ